MTKNGNTIIWRVEQLENCSSNLEGKVDKIMENHLPHLHEEIQSLKVRVNLGISINILLFLSGVISVVLLLR